MMYSIIVYIQMIYKYNKRQFLLNFAKFKLHLTGGAKVFAVLLGWG